VAGAQDTREQLVEEHMGLVRAVARRYARPGGEPVEDLVQVGAIGLIKAIDRFEPGRGRDLRALAVPAIEGEIRHHLRDRGSLVRTPRPVHELGARARQAEARLSARDGRQPSVAAIAVAVGAPEAAVAEALRAGEPAAQLDPDRTPAAPDALAEQRALIAAGMDMLSEREQRILRLRFFEDRSQVEIARELGLSQAHVSRLVHRALERLRSAVVEPGPEAYPRLLPVPIEERRPTTTHSGRLLLRMPQSLHAELARVAEREGVSLNTLISSALASAVGWRDGTVAGVNEEGDAEPEPQPERAAPPEPAPSRHWTSLALAANLVVVAIVAVVAIVLLIIAVHRG
jgi:RNA polymerase sigma-B factor